VRGTGMTRELRADSGFSLPELMFVVLIIGILLVIVIPVLVAVSDHAAQKTCYANQRELDGVMSVWANEPGHDNPADLAGVVGASHVLMSGEYILHVPRCPAGPTPANPADPTVAEGAYTITATGTIVPCTWGDLGPHGTYLH